MTTIAPPGERQAVLRRRIRLFVAGSMAYNVIEAIIAISAGTRASSAALIGFGLDSVIKVVSAAAVAWQFAGRDPLARERRTLRIIACSFFTLACYIVIDSVLTLFGGVRPEHSTPGLILAAVSLVVMPALSLGQRRAGRELNSRSAVADSAQTMLCTYLSAVLFLGLALNSAFGWSFADPVAALVIAIVAVHEGRQAWKGDTCCAPSEDTGLMKASEGVRDTADGCDCCAQIPPAAAPSANQLPTVAFGRRIDG